VPAVALAKKMIDEGRLGKIVPLPGHVPSGLDRGPQHAARVAASGRHRRVGFAR
jgi:predicted dehydrogenase